MIFIVIFVLMAIIAWLSYEIHNAKLDNEE